jgi:2-polyprenyl-3-methyl-5-hydroxy-6-metoxy-1,4-benzoquinol methylase
VRRFDWDEMRRYWETHSQRWADLDMGLDPEGLTNVCHPGAPLWLNRYYARGQRRAFDALMALVPAPETGAQALDVGCGAGRWSALLHERGYATTGIDLQPELIERNRARYPDITFERVAAQDLQTDARFGLITSVTVIQHVPFHEQDAVIARLAQLCARDGYVMALENVRDQDPHVFARSIRGWRTAFEGAGFTMVTMQRYDYSPMLRMVSLLRSIARRALRRRMPESPSGLVASGGSQDGLSVVSNAAKRAAVAIDSMIEPLLITQNVPLPTVHCGFLFKKV